MQQYLKNKREGHQDMNVIQGPRSEELGKIQYEQEDKQQAEIGLNNSESPLPVSRSYHEEATTGFSSALSWEIPTKQVSGT